MDERDLRYQSKKFTVNTNERPSHEDIRLGALLRIADAIETSAKNFDLMRESRDKFKRWYEEEQQAHQRTLRSLNALKGRVTRMKKEKDGSSNS